MDNKKKIVTPKVNGILGGDTVPEEARRWYDEKQKEKAATLINSTSLMLSGIVLFYGGVQGMESIRVREKDDALDNVVDDVLKYLKMEMDIMTKIHKDTSHLKDLSQLHEAYGNIATYIASDKSFVGDRLKVILGVLKGDLICVEKSLFDQIKGRIVEEVSKK